MMSNRQRLTNLDPSKGKTCSITISWDNGDGTMSTYSGVSNGFVFGIVATSPEPIEVLPDTFICGPDVVDSYILEAELCRNTETGKFGIIKIETIPEF